jgi:cell division septal protein FtsQ
MARKRKRPKRKLRAEPFLVLFLALSLYLGIMRSPITSLRHVRVQGAPEYDRARIDNDLQELAGVPCLQINPRRLESKIMDASAVRSATLTRTIFGNGVLVVGYRTPVARIEQSKSLALSNEGVIYLAHDLPDNLPVVFLPSEAHLPVLTVSEIWEPQTIAKLAVLVRNLSPSSKESINLDESGRVKLHIGLGLVELGDCDKLDQKLQVLKDRLSRNPSELEQIAELNLTVPERPAFTPKSSRESKKEPEF